MAERAPLAGIEQRTALIKREPVLRLLGGDMQFEQHIHHPVALGCLTVDLAQQSHGVHRIDHRHVGHDILHLVGLQVSDEMPLDVGRQRCVLGLELLHMALAKHPLPLVVGLGNALGRVILAHRHQPHPFGQAVEHLVQVASHIPFHVLFGL